MDDEFAIPERAKAKGDEIFLQPKRLAAWIDELPRGNTKEAARQILGMLEQLNGTEFSYKQRLDAIQILRPEVDGLAGSFALVYHHVAYPLTPAKLVSFAVFERLFAELSNAYASLLFQRTGELHFSSHQDRDVVSHCALAIYYQSMSIVHMYSLYAQIPKDQWERMHRLYRCCDRYGLDQLLPDDPHSGTLADRYLQILMVSLAMPYHLMQGEVQKVYDYMGKCFGLYRLLPEAEELSLDSDALVDGRFFVDLQGREGPEYGYASSRKVPMDPRIIEIHPLLLKLEKQVTELNAKADIPFVERMERNFLRRLHLACEHRGERAKNREDSHDRLLVTVGLVDCHFLLSGDQAFQPEKDEVLLHGGKVKAPSALAGLSLVDLDDNVYCNRSAQEKLEKGKIKPRALGFDMESKENDIWARAEKVGLDEKTSLQKLREERSKQNRATLVKRNQSEGGAGMYCPPGTLMQARVGEVAAMAVHTADGPTNWDLCIVKWIRSLEDGGLELGLQSLSTQIVPVAVRSFQGAGANANYHPVLLIKKGGNPSLLLPYATYDIQSVLVLNYGDRYELVRLADLVRSTKSFNQYSFEPLSRTAELDQQVYKSLQQLLGNA